jgi:hypothetical protein
MRRAPDHSTVAHGPLRIPAQLRRVVDEEVLRAEFGFEEPDRCRERQAGQASHGAASECAVPVEAGC